MNIFEELLSFENNEDILSFRLGYKNTLIWPLVRFFILRKVMSSYILKDNIGAIPKYSSSTPFYDNVIKNPFLTKHKDIVFWNIPAISEIKNKHGLFYNRVFDYFAMERQKQTIEIKGNKIYPNDGILKYQFANTRYIMAIEHIIKKLNKGKKCSCEDEKNIFLFVQYLKSHFPVKMDVQFYFDLSILLKNAAISLENYDLIYGLLLKKIKPKIVFIHCASYGMINNVSMIRKCRELGVISAEFQHGYIIKTHEAYNFSDFILKNNEFRNTLPDYLLTYGKYWDKYMRSPVQKVVIGNPHFTENVYNKKKSFKTQKKSDIGTVLIVTSGSHEGIIELLNEIEGKIGIDFRILLKIHPSEILKNAKIRYAKFLKIKGFEIRQKGNIYHFLNYSDFVIVDYSTVLMESRAMGIPTFILKNKCSEIMGVGNDKYSFSTGSELLKLMEENKGRFIAKEQYFDLNWKNNYQKFLNDVGI